MKLVIGVPLLTAVYLAVLASAAPWDVAIGAMVAIGVLLLPPLAPTREDVPVPPWWRRALGFPPFAAAVIADTAAGSVAVAAIVLGLRPLRAPGFVRVPIGERSERGVAVSALVLTLSPGSVLIGIDWPRREMIFHVIDGSDPDAVRRKIQRFYERWQRPVFP